MTDFGQLDLPSQLAQAIRKLEFTTPTPIQAQAIPVALAGRDIVGCAQTGTGKTAAFSIPLVAKLAVEHGKDAVILAPTRELAQQITGVLRQLTEQMPRLRPALIIGGASLRAQTQALRRHPRILVATPGRLIDHLGSKTIALDRVGFLVLDEADQMLDMGFAPQLNQILKHLPKERQTLLFSATLPEKILDLAKRFLNDPARITVGVVSRPVERIKQGVARTTADRKNDLLLDELNARKGSTLIFVRTKSRTEKLHKYLTEYGYSVERLHGGRSQSQRSVSLKAFRAGEIRILVATDIAARGLDIPHIEHVINFDLPMAPEDYVHRIGRTARAGRIGEALAILLPEDEAQWRRIQRLITPEEKREKTFSRPPIGPRSRRFDDRRDANAAHASSRRDANVPPRRDANVPPRRDANVPPRRDANTPPRRDSARDGARPSYQGGKPRFDNRHYDNRRGVERGGRPAAQSRPRFAPQGERSARPMDRSMDRFTDRPREQTARPRHPFASQENANHRRGDKARTRAHAPKQWSHEDAKPRRPFTRGEGRGQEDGLPRSARRPFDGPYQRRDAEHPRAARPRPFEQGRGARPSSRQKRPF